MIDDKLMQHAAENGPQNDGTNIECRARTGTDARCDADMKLVRANLLLGCSIAGLCALSACLPTRRTDAVSHRL